MVAALPPRRAIVVAGRVVDAREGKIEGTRSDEGVAWPVAVIVCEAEAKQVPDEPAEASVHHWWGGASSQWRSRACECARLGVTRLEKDVLHGPHPHRASSEKGEPGLHDENKRAAEEEEERVGLRARGGGSRQEMQGASRECGKQDRAPPLAPHARASPRRAPRREAPRWPRRRSRSGFSPFLSRNRYSTQRNLVPNQQLFFFFQRTVNLVPPLFAA